MTPSSNLDVHGAGEMLHRIEALLRSYLSFPDDRYYLPLALFAILQHCWDECFDEVPYLSVSAMVKSAGKTRVLELLSFLAGEEKAILVDGSVTVAALYTEIEDKKVILIDESERLQNLNSPFRSILNGGYRRGQTVLRKIGTKNAKFSIFCPKVFAQIGDLHDTLRDRCIVVEMQRTMVGDRKEYVRQVAREKGNVIANEIAGAVLMHMENIQDAYANYHELYPSMNFLRDRDREIWKPLFALCQVFASERLSELEQSAIDIATLKNRSVRRFGQLKEEEESTRQLEYAEHLLRDALVVVGDCERITTSELVKKLRGIRTSPWRTYEGEGITDISAAAMFKLFGFRPKTIRVKPKGQPNSTAKGYLRADMVAGTTAAQAQPNAGPERNQVTPVEVAAPAQPSAVPVPVSLPILGQCGGCQDMHRGIAAKAEANPDWNDRQLSEDSGCSLTIVRQAKTRYLEWKQVKGETKNAVCLPHPASNYTIHQGNVLDILPTLPSNYFAGSLSDPPYELGFMGKKWDSSGIAFNPLLWAEMYRVLAPDAYILAFGGSRTFHRLTSAIEDAGFEVRDHIMWLYGTGFPKSRATLKPGYEPIVLARKPAERGLLLNIDQCRINPGEVIHGGGTNFNAWRRLEGREATSDKGPRPAHNKGRYPTNVILDEDAAAQLGEASRFFYTPKSNRKERDAALGSFAAVPSYMVASGSKSNSVGGTPRTTTYRNPHPTVKPLALTKWPASLIKPEENRRLLVPFSGFRPTAAAVIYDRYLPQAGGVTWDMSAGFGGRLLGAMASNRVTKYIGTDPSTLTMDGLREMRDELLPMLSQLGYMPPNVELSCVGSENLTPEPDSIDLCFTSPPYWGHERYADEATQSYIRFPSPKKWLNGYMKMTLANCRIGLKRDGILVVNIAGVKSYPTLHDDFVSLAVANGWRLVETLRLALGAMPGTRAGSPYKFEPVYGFRKAK